MTGSNLFSSVWVTAYTALSAHECIFKFVLIQHILSTQVSDTGPMILWLNYNLDKAVKGLTRIKDLKWIYNICNFFFFYIFYISKYKMYLTLIIFVLIYIILNT